jgi:hypothetical protein
MKRIGTNWSHWGKEKNSLGKKKICKQKGLMGDRTGYKPGQTLIQQNTHTVLYKCTPVVRILMCWGVKKRNEVLMLCKNG